MRELVVLSPVIISSSFRSYSLARWYCRSVSANVSSATSPRMRSATSHCIDILRNGGIIWSGWPYRFQLLLQVLKKFWAICFLQCPFIDQSLSHLCWVCAKYKAASSHLIFCPTKCSLAKRRKRVMNCFTGRARCVSLLKIHLEKTGLCLGYTYSWNFVKCTTSDLPSSSMRAQVL